MSNKVYIGIIAILLGAVGYLAYNINKKEKENCICNKTLETNCSDYKTNPKNILRQIVTKIQHQIAHKQHFPRSSNPYPIGYINQYEVFLCNRYYNKIKN